MFSNKSWTTSHATSGWPLNTVERSEAIHLPPSNVALLSSNCANRFSILWEPSLQAGSKVRTAETCVWALKLAGEVLKSVLKCRCINMSGSVGSLESVWKKMIPRWWPFPESLPLHLRTSTILSFPPVPRPYPRLHDTFSIKAFNFSIKWWSIDDDDIIWALFKLALPSPHVSGAGMLTVFADLNLVILDQFLDKLTMVWNNPAQKEKRKKITQLFPAPVGPTTLRDHFESQIRKNVHHSQNYKVALCNF